MKDSSNDRKKNEGKKEGMEETPKKVSRNNNKNYENYNNSSQGN